MIGSEVSAPAEQVHWMDRKKIADVGNFIVTLESHLPSPHEGPSPSFAIRLDLKAYCAHVFAIETLFGGPDCARYFIFAGYLIFMWGIVGLSNYLDAVDADS